MKGEEAKLLSELLSELRKPDLRSDEKEALATQLSKAVRRLVRKHLRSESVDDVAQEVWVVVESSLGDVVPGKEVAWLYGVIRNKAVSHVRQQQRWKRWNVDDERALERADSVFSSPVDQLEARAVLEELEEFPEKMKLYLEAVAQGDTPSEIAARNGVTESAVRSHISGARKRLRKLLKRRGRKP